MAIPPRLIRETAAELQGVDFAEARATEIAIEVERLNTAVRLGAQSPCFDAEPGTFLAALAPRRR